MERNLQPKVSKALRFFQDNKDDLYIVYASHAPTAYYIFKVYEIDACWKQSGIEPYNSSRFLSI